ncbi:transposase [Corynebacterium sp. 35RC1]|nr:transposase [Corynebacterium sp. 35RC1]
MSAKRYDEQFKRDAVAFYEDNLGLSLQQASSDLGINRATLKRPGLVGD